jgi:hypothetical protein
MNLTHILTDEEYEQLIADFTQLKADLKAEQVYHDASPNGLPVVYVGRPTKWGNPYELKDYSRELALHNYRQHLADKLELDPYLLDPLKGKNLACWCPLDQPCHADILLKFLKDAKK